MLLAMAAACAIIAIRLVYIQGVSPGRYVAVARSELVHTTLQPAVRGAILDHTGRDLALSVPQTSITADPALVAKSGNAVAEAAALEPILGPVTGKTQAQFQAELSEHSQFVYLARTVDDATAAKVKALGLTGLSYPLEEKRFYPSGSLAAPLLGSVGLDGAGLAGLEYKYNALLTGRAGKTVQQVDPTGRPIAGGLEQKVKAIPGDDVVLTIDQSLQYEAEQELAKAILQSRAKSGIAMLMDSKTGDLLAVACLAMPNPQNGLVATPSNVVLPQPPGPISQNQPVESPSATAFTEVYEPGSINKLITISAALADGVIVPSSRFTIPNSYDVAGTPFHDAESHPTEHWDVTDILANSSNVGTIQIAQRLGKARLNQALLAYGLGHKTDIGFPGESDGLLLPPSKWSGTSIATVPIGQGIAVTATQMLAAYNTIANGGVYVAPRLVAGTINAAGREVPSPTPPPRRIVSNKVAREMTSMLDEVVRVGTGTGAAIPGYTVAGKTGTANVPSPKGGYLPAGHFFASFAGFVPSERPALTGIVMLDDTPDYGGELSAPTFGAIAQYGLREFKIPPQPKQARPAGVPAATEQSATAASPKQATTPLSNPPTTVAPTTSTTAPSTTASTVTSAAGAGGGVSATAAPGTTTVPRTVSTGTAPATTATVAARSALGATREAGAGSPSGGG